MDNTPDNIQFGIQEMIVERTLPAAGTFFANDFIGVEAFLNEHSKADYSDYCLAYRFTHRDFDGGVVGLAYVAAQPPSNNIGGICENVRTVSGRQQTLNTGIVTSLNYGQNIAPSLTALTFAHECGHNFGSNVSTSDYSICSVSEYLVFNCSLLCHSVYACMFLGQGLLAIAILVVVKTELTIIKFTIILYVPI